MIFTYGPVFSFKDQGDAFKSFNTTDQLYWLMIKLNLIPGSRIIDKTRKIMFVERPKMTEMDFSNAISITLDYLNN